MVEGQGLVDFEASYKKCLRDFVDWVDKNWRMEAKEKWPNIDPYPGDDYRNGYEAALESLIGALECYLDEHLYA